MAWKLLLFLSWLFVLPAYVTSSDLVVRNLPGKSSDETVYEVRRRLANRVKRAGTDVIFDNSTSFSLGLDGTTIFKYPFEDASDDGVSASISIICTKCYIKGRASAKLTANGSFNITSAIDKAKDNFETTWHNLTDYAQNLTHTILGEIGSDIKHLDFDELVADVKDIDPPDLDMNLNLLFPEYNVGVNLTDLEIYMELDTVLSAGITYTFNLYQSETIVGIALGDDLLLGAVFSIDLIFSVDGKLDISSGFHVHFDNVLTHITLFGKEASKIDFDGGRLAFLPVKIRYGNVLLKAILRVEARIGIAFETFIDGISIDAVGLKALKIGAGVEARVYANIAEFVTNITLAEVDVPTKRDDDDDDNDDGNNNSTDNCLLSMAQAFTFGIGAAAGATVELIGNTWGPSPETEIPIFYTTLAQVCALTSTSSTATISATTTTTTTSPPSSAANPKNKRADTPSVTRKVTSETQVATVCASPGLINCPASLQTVTRNVITKTLTSTITPGVSVVWSTATAASVFNTVAFKDNAVTMTSSSGKPKTYTPPPPPQTSTSLPSGSSSPGDDDASAEGKSGSHRVSNAVIIGVSVGLGVPALLAAIGAFIYFFRRNRRASSMLVPAEPATTVIAKAQPVVATYAPVRPDDDL
ncbi:hypothetical protein M419DRAFT_71725 [Trichoderma reesei RUT C-30]|uniref:Mid2 domain-containing protein n=1 Tax=Hypocrea jecorina (strain ATCC 56765 / BCRC 32924 / NRRL 11460 / Rut C-30) TaxID=1344414 RepID=A0A024SLU4_HYPJR|nr:hypothetical protein M419DRAFT_71725 [Trichoderma reesei RUT C-30]